ncbi:MAG: sigma-70 family RNA polymerase sigma factor [Pseudonocardiaceae bacterium]|nr:sigma-70 family RNA polymerase sigma factor [Pseudonocardiaceae bacterium]
MSDSPSDAAADTGTQAFVEHRELLFSVVYSMLGSVADTEDVLQETWLAWAARNRRPDAEPIDNPRGYLVRIAVNEALARQAAIRRRRETYLGPWLPEPLLTADDAADTSVGAESVSIALLVVLESLSPLERAVFVLHEVFGYSHAEIAGIVGRSPAATRQLGHRAREHVHARRPRFKADPQVQRQVTERFVAAALGGDLRSLLELLAPDVTMSIDGGGKVPKAGMRAVRGRDKVARLITGLAADQPGELDIRYRQVNNDPSAVLFAGDSPFAVMVLDLTPEGEQVRSVYTVVNPDKLSHIER